MQWSNAIVLATWGACAASGLAVMLDYELTPAPTAAVARQWPGATQLFCDPVRPTLILFLHPHCPCSRATLRELDQLTAECGEQFALRIVFVKPPGTALGWEQTGLYRTAGHIPSAFVSSDPDGQDAARFGATTSGEALLYAADGRLLFHGGITPSRGHEGDNLGRTILTSIITTGDAAGTETVVFGCPLVNKANSER